MRTKDTRDKAINRDKPWLIRIAPTAWVKDSKNPTVPDGAVGWGVRLLDRMVADAYEG